MKIANDARKQGMIERRKIEEGKEEEKKEK